MSRPALPVITLEHGAYRAEVYDPRADPIVLGARYVHGGYVRALYHGERQLTTRLTEAWDRFDGEGLPETFDSGLGWGPAPLNEEFLRIGAGRLRRIHNSPREHMASAPLVGVLEWRLTHRSKSRVSMTTADELLVGWGQRYGYRLERTVAVDDEGLVSSTRLSLSAEAWQGQLLGWYAHPFVPQAAIDQTAIAFPGKPEITGPLVAGPDGLWRMTEHNGRAVAAGLWGERDPITMHLDAAQGGGRLGVALDRPLDHAVVFATRTACSVEPKIARFMTHNETATWNIRYRFSP